MKKLIQHASRKVQITHKICDKIQINSIAVLSLSLCALMSGCTVGPDYKRPTISTPTALSELPNKPLSDNQHYAQTFIDQDISTGWWEAFHSEALNGLIQQALKNNPSIEIAQANLKQAIESVKVQQAAYFPTVTADFNPTRQKVAGQLASPMASNSYIYNLHTAQLNASYTLDLWGANKRQIESLKAQEEASRYSTEVTYLTLVSNVVNAAIQEAVLREQIRITQTMIERQHQLTKIILKARALGQMSEADVATQQSAEANVEASLPPLQKQLAIQRDLIKALVGSYPSDHLDAEFTLDRLNLPEQLPQVVPSSLLERRPDIRVSEAMMQSASSNIGVAKANRLPNISLSAGIGSSAEKLSHLFASTTEFWSLAANLTQPIFDSGALKHKENLAKSAYEATVAQYKSTVISAFQNVGDVLQSIQNDQQGYDLVLNAASKNKKSFDLAQKQYKFGDISRVTLLPIEQNYLQSQLAVAQAQGNRLQDSAALFQALGGGWWSSSSTKKP